MNDYLTKLKKKFNFNKSKFDLSMRVQDISLQQLLKIFREVNP